MEQEKETPILLRRKDVEKRVGLTRSALYERMAGGSFPQPITLVGTRTVRWIEAEIRGWIQTQICESRKDGERSTGAEHAAAMPRPKACGSPRRAPHTRGRVTANQPSAKAAS